MTIQDNRRNRHSKVRVASIRRIRRNERKRYRNAKDASSQRKKLIKQHVKLSKEVEKAVKALKLPVSRPEAKIIKTAVKEHLGLIGVGQTFHLGNLGSGLIYFHYSAKAMTEFAVRGRRLGFRVYSFTAKYKSGIAQAGLHSFSTSYVFDHIVKDLKREVGIYSFDDNSVQVLVSIEVELIQLPDGTFANMYHVHGIIISEERLDVVQLNGLNWKAEHCDWDPFFPIMIYEIQSPRYQWETPFEVNAERVAQYAAKPPLKVNSRINAEVAPNIPISYFNSLEALLQMSHVELRSRFRAIGSTARNVKDSASKAMRDTFAEARKTHKLEGRHTRSVLRACKCSPKSLREDPDSYCDAEVCLRRVLKIVRDATEIRTVFGS